jgi:magnesium chelatase family protein
VLAKVLTCAVIGLDGALVEVEADIGTGLPAFNVVGLPDASVQESRERVRAAIRNSGCVFPLRRVTVNLAPADLKKEGPAYDLPIALALVMASQQVPDGDGRAVFLGELSLDGDVRHVDGILPMVSLARDKGVKSVFVPAVDALEASLVEGIEVVPVRSFAALVDHLRGDRPIERFAPDRSILTASPVFTADFRDVKGQEHAKRALEVAATGQHNVLMTGPPGSGKTLLARAVPSIMPPLTSDEALDVTKIYSVAGMLPPETPLIRARPFRAPHHTISSAGLVGGGRWPRPGEISLAHRGVLFLDEFPEFGPHVLELMRQPLEDGTVTISRAQGSVSFPAKLMLVGAMNPCPCGFLGDSQRACTCTPTVITRYQHRLSGPLLDRIDIHLDVPRVEYEKLSDSRLGEPSSAIRARVEAARERQRARFRGTKITANAEMGPAEVRDHCKLDPAAQNLIRMAMQQLKLSARGYHRVLKLSRTIADLAGSDLIGAAHVAEAVQYRPRERV